MWLSLIVLAMPFSSGGHPISPECIGALVTNPEQDAPATVSLSACNAAAGIELKGKAVIVSDPESRSFTQYEPIGALPNGDWVIRWLWNGGGSGNFSGVGVFRLTKTTLERLRVLNQGDRCNGGTADVSIAGSKVKFSASVTPVDVLRAGGAPDDAVSLESSAMSCVAKLELVDDHVVGATLDADLEDRQGWTERFTQQHCYNALQNQVAKKTPHLDLAGLKAFAKQFATQCMNTD